MATNSSSTPPTKAAGDKKRSPPPPQQATNAQVAVQFQLELNSILKTRPPVSKDKMGVIVKEALKAIRSYKHVVYYVETFIKTVRPA